MAQNSTRHHGRDDLAGEHAFGDTGQVLLLLVFAVIWGADTFVVKKTTFLNQYVPMYVRLAAGGILLVLSGYVARSTMGIVFGEVREVPVVIRKGIYNVIRHPMYLSEIVLYLGLLVMSMSLAAGVVWIAAIVFLYSISRHEEKLLVERFGDEYRTYMREVPLWIPRLWKR